MGPTPVPNCPGPRPEQFGTCVEPIYLKFKTKAGPKPALQAELPVLNLYATIRPVSPHGGVEARFAPDQGPREDRDLKLESWPRASRCKHTLSSYVRLFPFEGAESYTVEE
jgi:hypothetical protein